MWLFLHYSGLYDYVHNGVVTVCHNDPMSGLSLSEQHCPGRMLASVLANVAVMTNWS